MPFGQLWYGEPNAVSNAVDCAQLRSRSHYVVIQVYDSADNAIETQQHAGLPDDGALHIADRVLILCRFKHCVGRIDNEPDIVVCSR